MIVVVPLVNTLSVLGAVIVATPTLLLVYEKVPEEFEKGAVRVIVLLLFVGIVTTKG